MTKIKTNIKIILTILMAVFLVSCSRKSTDKDLLSFVTDGEKIVENTRANEIFKGLSGLGETVEISALSPSSKTRYTSNIENAIKNKTKLVVTNSPVYLDSFENIASKNLDTQFLAFDAVLDESLSNSTSVMFKVNESAFLVGYLAGLETKENSIGYIGLEKNLFSDLYEYGFKAGVLTAARELNKEIEIKVRRVRALDDFNAGKDLANEMYKEVDIIYQSVGLTGIGVIESAKNNKKLVIGNQIDQSYLAPKNVLISAINNYEFLADKLAKEIYASNKAKGNLFLGIKDEAVTVSKYSEDSIYSLENYNKLINMTNLLKNSEIIVPVDEKTWSEFSK